MDGTVRVEFDPPRTVREVGKAWIVTVDGQPDLALPKSQTQLERDGDSVTAATIPRWLAAKEELTETADCFLEEKKEDTMSRDDWYRLGMAVACVIRGDKDRDVPWNARKLAQRLLTEE